MSTQKHRLELASTMRLLVEEACEAGVKRQDAEMSLADAIIVGIAQVPFAVGRKELMEMTIEYLRTGLEKLEKEGMCENRPLPAADLAFDDSLAPKV